MNLDERARRAAEALRSEAARIDTDELLSRIEGQRRRWVAPAAAVAAIASVLLVVVVVLPSFEPDGIEVVPDPVGPSPTMSPTPPNETETDVEPEVAGVGTWTRVDADAFAGLGGEHTRLAVHPAGGAVIVGEDESGPALSSLPPDEEPTDPAAWDTVATDLCGEASCELNDVTVTGDTFVAVGMLDSLPSAWTSDDGRDWERAEVDWNSTDPGPRTLTAVAAYEGGLVAFGTEEVGQAGSQPVVFTSSDGSTWSEAQVDFTSQEAGAHPVAAGVTSDGQVIAVGYVGDGTVVWEEQDGAWTERHLSEDEPEFSAVTTFVESLRRGADGELLMPGAAHGGQDLDGRVWRSDDGATWSAMEGELGGPGDQRVTDVVYVGEQLMAVGWTSESGGGDPRPAAWVLDDGDTWQPMEADEAFEEAGAITAALPYDSETALTVGHDGAGSVVVWVHESGDRSAQLEDSRECSAGDMDAELPPQEDLPDPVSDMRAAIRDAAVDCDFEGLAELALEGDRGFTYSFGDDGDPAGYWLREEEDGEETLQILARLLESPFGTVETQFIADEYETVYVWPQEYATEDEYLEHRVGITTDGEWVFYVAGD